MLNERGPSLWHQDKNHSQEMQWRKGHDLNDHKSHLTYGAWKKLQVGFFQDYGISLATLQLGHKSKRPPASQKNESQHPHDKMGQCSPRDAPKVIPLLQQEWTCPFVGLQVYLKVWKKAQSQFLDTDYVSESD